MPFQSPKPGALPKQNSRMSSISNERSRPLRFYLLQIHRQGNIKVLSMIFCTVSRAIHLELVPNLTTQDFIKVMEELRARWGNPMIVYSDNVKTFQAGVKWFN